MLDFLLKNSINFWVIVAVLFIALEIFLGWSVIFFFIIGSAAFFVGIFLFLNVVTSVISQLTVFFLFVLFCGGGYWLIFKRLSNNKNGNYKNIGGQIAHVVHVPIVKGEIGQVKWSGTVCKAMLATNSEVESLEVGDKVVILDIKSNILIVKKNF